MKNGKNRVNKKMRKRNGVTYEGGRIRLLGATFRNVISNKSRN
jgi:hypothetical protein